MNIQVKFSNIMLALFGILMMTITIGICSWKRIFRIHRPIYPHRNPQVAFIAQGYPQQPPYQTLWTSSPSQLVESPPPSYFTVVENGIVPSTEFYRKQ
ncbi:unnamed protein product [Rotaria magnacalcarata]|uniref:Uncharacterized protein n=1 Tax=Rotaria magnacalcarata TaxID=392030 RepID=A0A815X6U3_9BILA|nr:unnamed protein product [Rotaria magnacalcarata]CAF1553279.1 unnamed protein product [Rotaria magnacalcarata]CAF2043032.1 unnamed protein product [Rotaria magnacalcarata]CAF2101378.1 unnamed protein product [Rotaria magnacalcarata]CAF2117115.1 unnamed protein product [Rotaria magnacalcarata]